MPGVFVTATGTEVGKTYVTAGLIRAGRRAGVTMDAFKPVLSGYRDEEAAASDAGLLLAALDREVTTETVAAISPWRFAAPLSPDMAAALEHRAIDVEAVIDACRARIDTDPLTLIEGVGGVMVPLDAPLTILDVIAALGTADRAGVGDGPRRDQPLPHRARGAAGGGMRRTADRAQRNARLDGPARGDPGDDHGLLCRQPDPGRSTRCVGVRVRSGVRCVAGASDSAAYNGTRGCSSMVEQQPSKLNTRVRFPVPAPPP